MSLEIPDLKMNLLTIMAMALTAGFFETGAMSTPTKSQNPTNCG